jgi:hypothetical protein
MDGRASAGRKFLRPHPLVTSFIPFLLSNQFLRLPKSANERQFTPKIVATNTMINFTIFKMILAAIVFFVALFFFVECHFSIKAIVLQY